MWLIRATSRDGTFRPFAASTRLPIVWSEEVVEDHGRAYGRQFAGRRILISVSRRDWRDFNGQVGDAIEFLCRWQEELLRLAASHDLEQFALEFPVTPSRGRSGRSVDQLPIELILLLPRRRPGGPGRPVHRNAGMLARAPAGGIAAEPPASAGPA